MKLIEADFGTLLTQSYGTAGNYLREAVQAIDAEFGKGYASSANVLVAAVITAMEKDFTNSSKLKVFEQISENICVELSRLADVLGDLKND